MNQPRQNREHTKKKKKRKTDECNSNHAWEIDILYLDNLKKKCIKWKCNTTFWIGYTFDNTGMATTTDKWQRKNEIDAYQLQSLKPPSDFTFLLSFITLCNTNRIIPHSSSTQSYPVILSNNNKYCNNWKHHSFIFKMLLFKIFDLVSFCYCCRGVKYGGCCFLDNTIILWFSLTNLSPAPLTIYSHFSIAKIGIRILNLLLLFLFVHFFFFSFNFSLVFFFTGLCLLVVKSIVKSFSYFHFYSIFIWFILVLSEKILVGLTLRRTDEASINLMLVVV